MNVVFDLGGVVLTWNPSAVAASVFDSAAERALVFDHVVGHPDWMELDRGALDHGAAIERAAARCGLERDAIARFFEAALRSLVPVPEVVVLVEAVRSGGHGVFVLSNMDRTALDHIERTHDVFRLFDGRVVSCEVGWCKPEPEIYRLLLERHALDPAQTVFIDDLQVNLDAASAFGIRTVRFEGVEPCRAQLRRLGCILETQS